MQEGKMTVHFIRDDPADVLQFRFLDQNGKITKNSIKSAITPPYPLKYYITGVLFIIALTVFLLWNYGVIRGTELGFFCNDPLFSHKYRGDTVTPVILGVGLAFIFISIYSIVEYVRQGKFKQIFSHQNGIELYLYHKQYLIGLLLAGGITELAKTIVGEHRPHFFDTCMPDSNMNCTNGTYLFTYTCTNTDVTYLQIIDSSRSFPSGHSSMSWFAALYSAYIVHSRLPINRTGTGFKLLMITICLLFGLVCSLTRITDRRHHWWDVLFGTIIGIIAAVYTIRVTEKQIAILQEQIRIREEYTEKEETNIEIEYDV